MVPSMCLFPLVVGDSQYNIETLLTAEVSETNPETRLEPKTMTKDCSFCIYCGIARGSKKR